MDVLKCGNPKTGPKYQITIDEIIDPFDLDQKHYFPHQLEQIPTFATSSISGNFIAMIIDGSLQLATMRSTSYVFLDILDYSNNYIYAAFTNDERMLFALHENEISVFSTLPTKMINKYYFFAQTSSVSFQLWESQQCIQIMLNMPENRDGNENFQVWYRLPDCYNVYNESNKFINDQEFNPDRDSPLALERIPDDEVEQFYMTNHFNFINNAKSAAIPPDSGQTIMDIRSNVQRIEHFDNFLNAKLQQLKERSNYIKFRGEKIQKRLQDIQRKYCEKYTKLQSLIELADKSSILMRFVNQYIKDIAKLDKLDIPDEVFDQEKYQIKYYFYQPKFYKKLEKYEKIISEAERNNEEEFL